MAWRDFGALRNIPITFRSPIPETIIRTHYSRLPDTLQGIGWPSMLLSDVSMYGYHMQRGCNVEWGYLWRAIVRNVSDGGTSSSKVTTVLS
jgi:hypothetical protein